MAKCIVKGCNKNYFARKMCRSHYRQQPDVKAKELEYQQNYRKTKKGKETVKRWNDNKGKISVKDYQQSFKARFNTAKKRAKKRNLEWNLTLEEYKSLLIPNMCHYCEAPVSVYGVGLDRLDNEKGYVWGNVEPCCAGCNKLKSDLLTHSEMLWVVDILKSKRGEKIW